MKILSRPLRLCRIAYVLGRYGRNKRFTRAERMRLILENLGPIFIKAGQVLSTRRDLLPDDVADELTKLQDKVPPFPGEIAVELIEKTLHLNLNEIFLEFDTKALASASIAQVHAATMLDGKSVAVKVLRPGIAKIINRDLDLLFLLAKLAERFWPDGRRFKPKKIVEEVAQTLQDELDLLREGANASQLKRNFANSTLLHVPEIHWAYSNSMVLVMERVYGIPIHNISALHAAKINMHKLAENVIEVFFTQVFRDSFFHADMHPGNIFVATDNLENPQLIAVDFGIVGSLNSKDQRYLAENMLAFFKRDYQRVAELHIASGWLPPDTRIDQFEGAIRAVCEPIFERPLKDISIGQMLLRLFQAARRFNVNIQPQLILLQKTLLNIEGLSRQIYPELDLWANASPYLERWLKRQVGGKALLRRMRENFPYWSEKLPEIPGLIFEVLQEQRWQQERKRFQIEFAEQHQLALYHSHKKRDIFLGLAIGFILTSGVMLFKSIDIVLVSTFLTLGIVAFVIAETL